MYLFRILRSLFYRNFLCLHNMMTDEKYNKNVQIFMTN